MRCYVVDGPHPEVAHFVQDCPALAAAEFAVVRQNCDEVAETVETNRFGTLRGCGTCLRMLDARARREDQMESFDLPPTPPPAPRPKPRPPGPSPGPGKTPSTGVDPYSLAAVPAPTPYDDVVLSGIYDAVVFLHRVQAQPPRNGQVGCLFQEQATERDSDQPVTWTFAEARVGSPHEPDENYFVHEEGIKNPWNIFQGGNRYSEWRGIKVATRFPDEAHAAVLLHATRPMGPPSNSWYLIYHILRNYGAAVPPGGFTPVEWYDSFGSNSSQVTPSRRMCVPAREDESGDESFHAEMRVRPTRGRSAGRRLRRRIYFYHGKDYALEVFGDHIEVTRQGKFLQPESTVALSLDEIDGVEAHGGGLLSAFNPPRLDFTDIEGGVLPCVFDSAQDRDEALEALRDLLDGG